MARPRSDETRRRLEVRALEVFCAKGFSGASMRDIARAVGLPVSAIYHYFPSKEELYAKVLYDAMDDLFLRLRAQVNTADDAAVEDFYTELLAVRAPERLASADLSVYRTSIVEWMGERGQSPLRDRLRELIERWGAGIRTHLKSTGYMAQPVSDEVADLLYAYMQYETMCNLFGIRAFDASRVRREIRTTLAPRAPADHP